MSELKSKHFSLIDCVRQRYGKEGFIPLHAPRFAGNEKRYLNDCIDSTFVSSVGAYVDQFEGMMRDITGARCAIATVNGTAALHIALILAGVKAGDEVITQPLTFVATCNAISYVNANPVFIDVDLDTLGLSPKSLLEFLQQNAELRDGCCYNRKTGRRIAAVLPMHTFGLPLHISEVAQICADWQIAVVEDAAESLGSRINGVHTGRVGLLGAFSFNGNKTVTCGGGGCIITDDDKLGHLAKHLTTTAKQAHPWAFHHDQIAYNYRMPNLNAAVACAQLERLDEILSNKRETAEIYIKHCEEVGIAFVKETPNAQANYWLNAVLLDSLAERDAFLNYSNENGVMTRPVWALMNTLPAFSLAQCAPMPNATWLADRLVNLPSGECTR
ncbi:LegC family aminotransferase [Chitinibacter tainanensis]|uniref:LegC family aminotransferase n=1 Tax=Chitinibacter tainanensis TaxID=230667 RepID=UPI002356276A|nr:LegC family aminotransferase [Chitinibacter tainanensis]